MTDSKAVELKLRRMPQPQQKTLRELRKTILEIVPQAQEVISYGFPGYKVAGKVICGFDAFKNHCSYFPHSSLVIPVLAEELSAYRTSKGAIQFPIDKPLPRKLVKKLIFTRMKQLGLK